MVKKPAAIVAKTTKKAAPALLFGPRFRSISPGTLLYVSLDFSQDNDSLTGYASFFHSGPKYGSNMAKFPPFFIKNHSKRSVKMYKLCLLLRQIMGKMTQSGAAAPW